MLKRLTLVSISLISSSAWSAAYKIPEQSLNATALSAAYVANANGADTTYYNPAAMVYNTDRSQLEVAMLYIYLPGIDFSGTSVSALGAVDGGTFRDSSKEEHFFVPTFHYVSPDMNNARFGLSVVSPAGLTKRWSGPAQAMAENFTLETIEINPTAAYLISDRFSVGGGLRALYSKGKVKSNYELVTAAPPGADPVLSRNLKGDSWDFGYNLAFHFKPSDNLSLAVTYRSKIDLSVEGDAKLSWRDPLTLVTPSLAYKGDASVKIPIPAATTLAAAFDLTPDTTVEVTYERTYWSVYEKLDFNYQTTFLSPHPLSAFDDPLRKDFEDSNTYRIGITYQYDESLKLMAGLAYDETPVPSDTLGFELPDSDAWVYSFGVDYKVEEQISVGAALLYSDKDSRSVSNSPQGISGEFTGAGAYLLTMGLKYTF